MSYFVATCTPDLDFKSHTLKRAVVGEYDHDLNLNTTGKSTASSN